MGVAENNMLKQAIAQLIGRYWYTWWWGITNTSAETVPIGFDIGTL